MTKEAFTVQVDALQLVLKYLKDIGIDAKANQQEYGAYIASTFYGKYASMAFGPQTPFLDPGQLSLRTAHAGRAQEPEPRQ